MIEYYFQNGHISSAHKQEDATDGISMYYFQHSFKVLDVLVGLKSSIMLFNPYVVGRDRRNLSSCG